MNNQINSTQYTLLESSIQGTIRGFFADVITFPLDVIKTRLQDAHPSERTLKLARQIFQQEGFKALYDGFRYQLGKTGIKQAWCWPVMTGFPRYLDSFGISKTNQQIFSGLLIATIDSFITLHFEKARISSIVPQQIPFSFSSIFKAEGYQGFSAYWMKRSVGMVSFLTVQQQLRDHCHKQSDELSLMQLTLIGTLTALIVSVLLAPFDFANTITQTRNAPLAQFILQQNFSRFYRGWPLNATSLIIQSVSSIFIMEQLEKNAK